jgi:glycerol-3-phosphate dehydrogenase
MGGNWTDGKPLVDGELADAPTFEQAFERFVASAASVKPQLPHDLLWILARRHGTGIDDLLDGVKTVADLGQRFGGHLYEAEVRYLMREEWAVEPDDVLWRRTKEGLHMTPAERTAFAHWMQSLSTANETA